MFTTLWRSNPAAALPLIVQTPVFVITHQEPADSIPAWGLYYFPPRSLLDWSAIYMRMETYFPFLQFATGMAGIVCIIVAMLKQTRPV